MLEEPGFVIRHPVTYLLRDLRGGTLEGIDVAELGQGFRVLDPCEDLLVRNDPHCHASVEVKDNMYVV